MFITTSGHIKRNLKIVYYGFIVEERKSRPREHLGTRAGISCEQALEENGEVGITEKVEVHPGCCECK